MSTASGALTEIVNPNYNLLKSKSLAEAEPISYASSDGRIIDGWFLPPQIGNAPFPLILHVHGGPHQAYNKGFYFEGQCLSTLGFASLYVNPRGSLGYGSAFAAADDNGEQDFDDLMCGVDEVIKTHDIDPSRLGITGRSYGGFMTNWTIGHTDRFSAAVSINGISNWISYFGLSDVGVPFHAGEARFGDPFRDEDSWLRYGWLSPIFYANNVTTPLLLLQGEHDFRCPSDQGEQMFTALRARSKIVEMVTLPGAGHILQKSPLPHQYVVALKILIDWFRSYV